MTTPARKGLKSASPLLAQVKDGLAAVERSHLSYFAAEVRQSFEDSLDLDAALAKVHSQENRWDYLLGHNSGQVVGVEPHSAKTDEITTVINKKRAAQDQLKGHLNPGAKIHRWIWVASGVVHFADTEKARRQLDQAGITFAGRQIQKKHLPPPPDSSPQPKPQPPKVKPKPKRARSSKR